MSAGNDPGAMRKVSDYYSPVEDDDHRDDDRYSGEPATVHDFGRSLLEQSPRPDEPISDDLDEHESLEELFGAVYELADQIASAINPDDVVEARLRRILRTTGPAITVYARTCHEARTIGEHFREGTPVIMNLTEMPDSDAKRLVDFSAGLIFGLRGSIERVKNKVFLLSPAGFEAAAGKELPRITTLHPRTYNEAPTIGEHFREGTPVIMNLTEMPDSDAKRLVDFSAGLIFGLRGSIERVKNKVFLLSPASFEDELGFFN